MSNVDVYQDSTSRFVDLQGMRVHFKREGQGPTVVLLHGSGSSLHSYDGVVARLAPFCDVIRLDLPGFGLTGPRPDRDYNVETYVDFLKCFLDGLQVNRVVLAGNSFGGNIAWNFALRHPTTVHRLVLMNATGYPAKTLPLAMRLAHSMAGRLLLRVMLSKRSTAANLRKLVGPRMASVPNAMVDRVLAMMKRPGNFQAFVDMANTPQKDRSGEIAHLRVPTLVLRGESIDGQFFARDIVGSREVVFPGVGHLLPDEAPIEVASAIREEAIHG
jgi:pimeloyl-ACP methyl ester carboxylesterase